MEDFFDIWVTYFFRYKDDIFSIWTLGQDKLEQFSVDFNKFHPTFKFTYESSRKNVNIFRCWCQFLIGQINTDLQNKATDRHQYLHYTSSHPPHTKRSIVSSQALRVSQILVENAIQPKLEKTTTTKKAWQKLCFFQKIPP